MEWTSEVTINTQKAKGPEFRSQEPEPEADPLAPGPGAVSGPPGSGERSSGFSRGREAWLPQGPQRGRVRASPRQRAQIMETPCQAMKEQLSLEALCQGQNWISASAI